MRLTVLGCSGTFPGPTSPCSGYLVEHDGFRMALDFGNGALSTLQVCGDHLDLDACVISHLHGDHCLDLVTYTYARRYDPRGNPGPMALWGPSSLEGRLCNSFDVPRPGYLDDVYDVHPMEAGVDEIGPFRVERVQVNHPIETYGIKVSVGDRSLVYSADTGECDALVELARGTDLFLCEASYLDGEDNPPGVHLTGRQAGEHAAKADVGRLVLTHLVPWYPRDRMLDDATTAFDGPISLAATCAAYEI